MDFISAFKSELFRPLVTLLIPGVIAGGPYFVLVGQLVPPLRAFGSRHPSVATAIVIATITAIGLVLENWGSRVETFWDDCLARKDATHKSTWDRYLQLRLKDEIIGQRYLRTFLVRMKFELAMVPASSCAEPARYG